MVKTIIWEYHFRPSEIDTLFFDKVDYWGLEYLYESVNDLNETVKKQNETKK